MRRTIKVDIEIPSGTSMRMAVDYIYDAVTGWKGGYHPMDQRRDIHIRAVRHISASITVTRTEESDDEQSS